MAKIKIGDRVRIKDHKDWPKPPGYRLANAEGTVAKWCEWEEIFEDFQDYAYVHLEKTDGGTYDAASMFFQVANLQKI
ncbi:MAG: hypothetical protein A2144_11270 [Chloroflexi bacterium RBG_16_50_9]|nr:MAG: hypothetical protein A2144_11270 [Chloroflexi bacterium RBG_16_50_9]